MDEFDQPSRKGVLATNDIFQNWEEREGLVDNGLEKMNERNMSRELQSNPEKKCKSFILEDLGDDVKIAFLLLLSACCLSF